MSPKRMAGEEAWNVNRKTVRMGWIMLCCIIPAGTRVTFGSNEGPAVVTPVLIIPPLEKGSEV
jgi:hypothetical protein